MIFFKDINLIYQGASIAFSKLVGYDNPQDLIGKTDYDLFPKDLAEKYIKDDHEIILNGMPYIKTLERITLDGAPRYSSTTKYPIYHNGNLCGLYGIGHEVSDLIKINAPFENKLFFQQKITDEQIIFKSCINITNDIVDYFITNKTIKIDDGSSYDLSLTKVCDAIYTEKDREIFSKTFSRENLLNMFSAGHNSISIEFQYILENKEIIWVRNEFSLLQNKNNQCVIGFSYLYDINEEKTYSLINKFLVKKDYDVIALYDTTKDTLLSFTNTISNNTTLTNNYSDIYSFRMRNHIPKEFFRECMIKMHPKNIIESLKKTNVYSFTFPFLNNSNVYYKTWSHSYIEENKIVFTQVDVTEVVVNEHKQKEILANALKKANAANEAKSAFLSRISHDLRTPMNSIFGLINLTLEEDLSPVTRENLELISQSSRYLLSLINDTLDMSLIEKNKIILNNSFFNLKTTLEDYVAYISHLCIEKKQSFRYYIDKIKTINLEGDHTKLKQILVNIALNSIKYTPENGEIIFSIEEIASSLGAFEIKIIDNGIGISKSFLPHIFEPFSQEDDKNAIYGAGLGLSIVKSFVDIMGGNITITSKKNVGTCVTVKLSFTPYKKRFPLPKNYDFSYLNDKHILLCEDHYINAQIVKKSLNKKKCYVDIAKDGLEGLNMFTNSPLYYYDAILMDIRMPILDGYKATKAIRALNREDAKLPIIAMSANAFEHEKKEANDCGMNSFIGKPYDPIKLYDLLMQEIKKHLND